MFISIKILFQSQTSKNQSKTVVHTSVFQNTYIKNPPSKFLTSKDDLGKTGGKEAKKRNNK